jgi:hypothetical protein
MFYFIDVFEYNENCFDIHYKNPTDRCAPLIVRCNRMCAVERALCLLTGIFSGFERVAPLCISEPSNFQEGNAELKTNLTFKSTERTVLIICLFVHLNSLLPIQQCASPSE